MLFLDLDKGLARLFARGLEPGAARKALEQTSPAAPFKRARGLFPTLETPKPPLKRYGPGLFGQERPLRRGLTARLQAALETEYGF